MSTLGAFVRPAVAWYPHKALVTCQTSMKIPISDDSVDGLHILWNVKF